MLTMLPSDIDDFEVALQQFKSTLKHELSHMVQYIMKETLRQRGKGEAAKNAGTPYSPKHPAPPEADPEEVPEDDDDEDGEGDKEGAHKAKRDRYENLRKVYPKAKEADLYYLSPIEFYPQIGTWVHQFLKTRPAAGETPQQMLKRWKEFVGIGTNYTWAEFYRVLKQYDQRLWQKAGSEGWKLLNKQLEKNAARAKQPA
jgi:hypothetical protein